MRNIAKTSLCRKHYPTVLKKAINPKPFHHNSHITSQIFLEKTHTSISCNGFEARESLSPPLTSSPNPTHNRNDQCMHVYVPHKYRFPMGLRLLLSRLQQSDESAFLREEFRRFPRSSHVHGIREQKEGSRAGYARRVLIYFEKCRRGKTGRRILKS